jgi:hypothetical protein
MRILTILFFFFAILAQQVAFASPQSDALGACLKDNTSGKDRKELARWMFIAMSAHPEIRALTTATEATRTEADQRMAALVTRLLTENCPAQMRAAIEKGSNQGMVDAFKSLGEVAMMELMSNPDVSASIGGYTQFIDKKKFDAVFAPK